MNGFEDIEKELRNLRPIRPSQGLAERIARDLESSSAVMPPEENIIRPIWFRFGGFSLGAALAAAAAIFILARIDLTPGPARNSRVAASTPAAHSPAPVATQFIPEGATRVVYHTQDEGLVFPHDSATPVRRMRSRTRETLQWKNPHTGESIRVTYPSEEVRLIPVSGQ
jgi:hypothetical protein